MPSLPSFPAPDLQGVLDAISEVFNDLVNEGTGTITNITQSVLDIWEMDCGGKWIIYVNTATVAATRALWLLLTPSLDEILENYLEPKPGRRHGRRGQRGDRQRRRVPGLGYRLFFRPPIPDIDESIADLIPGRNALRGRRMAPGEWIFWTSINVADAILWHWLLLEATETFTTTWQSELMQSGECRFQNDASAQFSAPLTGTLFHNTLWTSKGNLNIAVEENLNIHNNSVIQLDNPNTVGNWLTIVLATFRFKRDNTPGYGLWRVGITITIRNTFDVIVSQKTTFNTLSASQDQEGVALVDCALLTGEGHKVTFTSVVETIQGASLISRLVSADISAAVRGIHPV